MVWAAPSSSDVTSSTGVPRPTLSVVVPIFNELATLPELIRRLKAACDKLACPYEIILVNDGSSDGSTDWLNQQLRQESAVVVVHLTRNFGHQAAVCAGLDQADGDAVVVMDGDLQDPPELIPQFVQQWRAGYDVVYAIRRQRPEHLLKRVAYAGFYRALRAISEVPMPLDSGDFGLMDRKVVLALRQMPERGRFVRGLRAFVGFRQIGLPYIRHPRAGGHSKYTLRQLCSLATEGLLNFSAVPLLAIVYLGVACGGLAGVWFGWLLYQALGQAIAPSGWAVTLAAVLGLSAAQLLSLGVVGLYLRRVFVEVKGRPTYLIAEVRAAPRPARRVA